MSELLPRWLACRLGLHSVIVRCGVVWCAHCGALVDFYRYPWEAAE